MMTLAEANALPIPEEYKATPNIYRLSRIIASSEHSDKIMTVLPLALSLCSAQQKEGDPA